MAGVLNGRRVAILAADGVERVELERPRQALEDAGARTEVLSIHDGEIAARNQDLEDAGTFVVDRLVGAASVEDYEALLLPGGTVNPDKLYLYDQVKQQLRLQTDRPTAVREAVHACRKGGRCSPSASSPGSWTSSPSAR